MQRGRQSTHGQPYAGDNQNVATRAAHAFSMKILRGSQRGASWECQVTLERSNPDAWLDVAMQVLSAAAVAEFKLGSAERGRAIFENVLRNYPKRTDLWSVYLDQARVPPKGSLPRVQNQRPARPNRIHLAYMTVVLFCSSRQSLRHNTNSKPITWLVMSP